MNSLFGSIRWKLVGLFFVSAALSGATSGVLFIFVTIAYSAGWFRDLIRMAERTFGVVPILSVTALVLFIFYVILLSWRPIRYLVRITNAVKQISLGRLDLQIPVRTRDELGQLAGHINEMTVQLQSSLEEERRAVQGKNELITNVSHDLRTPLTSIIGYLQLIEDDRYKDEVELRHYTRIAHEKSLRLNRMVNDLFEYTRMNYSYVALERAEIDLLELLGALAADFALQLQEVGMELRLAFPDHRVIISADGDRLMRVFENLISNAIKYGGDGEHIDIAVRMQEGQAVVRVVNYGTPIPQAELPHIFERFYRVDKSRSDETGGTGLGLAIVRSIVELHGGTIAIASDERETAFEVKLPIV